LVVSFQLSKEVLADSTARSVSSFEPNEIVANGSSLQGLITSQSFTLKGFYPFTINIEFFFI
jgi:hypothetical protein